MTTNTEVPAATPAQEKFQAAYDAWGLVANDDQERNDRALCRMIMALNDQLAELRDQVRSEMGRWSDLVGETLEAHTTGIERAAMLIDGLTTRVIQHDAAINGAAPTREGATRGEPAMRIRLNHVHTLKEGHRLSETTVEWCGPAPVDWRAITEAQRDAFASGQIEAALRNRPSEPLNEEMD